MIKKILLCIVLWTISLGAFYVLPTPQKHPELSQEFSFYSSVCEISTGTRMGSGVLLESGYILTVAHNIDINSNGELDDNEKLINAHFHSTNFEVQLEVLAISDYTEDGEMDIAICKPAERVPLAGIRLCRNKEYWSDVKIGTAVRVIGMTNGQTPANITDGRLITRYRTEDLHRNSANSYFGNSGGGVFTEDGLLIGISARVAAGQIPVVTPVIDPRTGVPVGRVRTFIAVPIAGSSLHVSAPAINNFVIDQGYPEALVRSAKCPLGPKWMYYLSWSGHFAASMLFLLSIMMLFKKSKKRSRRS